MWCDRIQVEFTWWFWFSLGIREYDMNLLLSHRWCRSDVSLCDLLSETSVSVWVGFSFHVSGYFTYSVLREISGISVYLWSTTSWYVRSLSVISLRCVSVSMTAVPGVCEPGGRKTIGLFWSVNQRNQICLTWFLTLQYTTVSSTAMRTAHLTTSSSVLPPSPESYRQLQVKVLLMCHTWTVVSCPHNADTCVQELISSQIDVFRDITLTQNKAKVCSGDVFILMKERKKR